MSAKPTSTKKRVSHSVQAVAATKKREQIVDLRIQGYSYADIGRMVGVSRDHAHSVVKDYMTEFRERMTDSLKHAVTIEVERLDQCIRVMYAKVLSSGDCDAARTLSTLMQRKSSYLGLDKAGKIEVDHKKVYVGVSPDDWTKMSEANQDGNTNISKI